MMNSLCLFAHWMNLLRTSISKVVRLSLISYSLLSWTLVNNDVGLICAESYYLRILSINCFSMISSPSSFSVTSFKYVLANILNWSFQYFFLSNWITSSCYIIVSSCAWVTHGSSSSMTPGFFFRAAFWIVCFFTRPFRRANFTSLPFSASFTSSLFITIGFGVTF